MAVKADHSYECTVYSTGQASSLYFTALTDADGTAQTYTECGDVAPAVTVPTGNEQQGKARICFIAGASGNFFAAVNAAEAGETANFYCAETTLYGGFNTNVADFNFLELRNTTESNITVSITAINYTGTVVIDGSTTTIPANNRFDVNIHAAAGAGVYGLIIVTHNGPKGAIQGEIAEYVLTSVTPLDFSKVGSTPLKPREE